MLSFTFVRSRLLRLSECENGLIYLVYLVLVLTYYLGFEFIAQPTIYYVVHGFTGSHAASSGRIVISITKGLSSYQSY